MWGWERGQGGGDPKARGMPRGAGAGSGVWAWGSPWGPGADRSPSSRKGVPGLWGRVPVVSPLPPFCPRHVPSRPLSLAFPRCPRRVPLCPPRAAVGPRPPRAQAGAGPGGFCGGGAAAISVSPGAGRGSGDGSRSPPGRRRRPGAVPRVQTGDVGSGRRRQER